MIRGEFEEETLTGEGPGSCMLYGGDVKRAAQSAGIRIKVRNFEKRDFFTGEKRVGEGGSLRDYVW